jgi:hypothetical protein
MTRGRLVGAALVIAILAVAIFTARPYLRGLSFVVRAADMQGSLRRLADYGAAPVAQRELQIPMASGTIAGRAYAPEHPVPRAVLLVPGLHPSGIEESRLNELARQLAAGGVAVIIPDIPELRQFMISPAITDAIEQSGSSRRAIRFASDGRVGMIGIGFSGGPTLVAAGRPGLGITSRLCPLGGTTISRASSSICARVSSRRQARHR